jgi:flagellar hook-length control protein FliK
MTATAPVLPPLPVPLPDAPPELLENITAGSAEIDPGFRALLAHLLPPRLVVGQATLPAAVAASASPAPERPAPELPEPSGPDAAPVQLPPVQTALAALMLAMASVPPPPPPVSSPSLEPGASEPRPAPNGRAPLPSAVQAMSMNPVGPVEVSGSTAAPVTGSDPSDRIPVAGASVPDARRPAVAAEVVEAPPASAGPDAAPPRVSPRAPTARGEAAPFVPTEPAADIVRTRDAGPDLPRVVAPGAAPPSSVDAGDSASVSPAPTPHASPVTREPISAGAPAEVQLSSQSRPPVEDREPVAAVRVRRYVEHTTAVRVEAATAPPAGVPLDSDPTTDRGAEQDHDPEARRDPGPSLTAAPAGVAAAPPRAAAVEEAAGPGITAAVSRSVVRQVVTGIGRLRTEGRQEVSLRLDPPELGAVRVEAVLNGPHLTLQIHASMPATRDALEQALPRLRESLAEHGIVPAQVTVNLGLDGSSRRFGGEGSAAPAPPAPAVAAPARIAPPARWLEAGADGVDLWV